MKKRYTVEKLMRARRNIINHMDWLQSKMKLGFRTEAWQEFDDYSKAKEHLDLAIGFLLKEHYGGGR